MSAKKKTTSCSYDFNEWELESLYKNLADTEDKMRENHEAMLEEICKDPCFLLRWNPAISSLTLKRYARICRNKREFDCNWSIYDHQKARHGNTYFMLRCDDKNPGIVWHGYFTTDPYVGKDWAGTNADKHYVDIWCCEMTPPDEEPLMTLAELKETIPEVDWEHGHSGELLTYDQGRTLRKFIDQKHHD